MSRLIINPKPCFPLFLLMLAKNGFQLEEKKRLSRMRGSVSLPRSIGESKPLLMFHSSLSLFYVFTFFYLYRVLSSSDTARKPKKCWQTLSGQFQHLYLHSIQEKKKPATSSSPTPPLKHFVSPTLLLSFAPWVIQSLTKPTLSWGAFWPGTLLPSVPLLYFSPLYVSYSFSK